MHRAYAASWRVSSIGRRFCSPAVRINVYAIGIWAHARIVLWLCRPIAIMPLEQTSPMSEHWIWLLATSQIQKLAIVLQMLTKKISVFLSFSSRLIDGTRVIYEVQMGNKSSAGGAVTKADDYSPRSGPEMPLPCHNDVVTDLLLCKTQKYPVLVSSSRDGVIKLWK